MKMLKFNEFTQWLAETSINEANVWRNQTANYLIHPKIQNKVPKELIDHTFIWTDEDVNSLSSPKFYLIPKNGRSEEITKEVAIKELKRPKVSLMKTVADSNYYLIVYPDTQFLLQAKEAGETTTNVKEGMVVLFYYSSINDCPNEHNARQIVQELRNLQVPEEALDAKTVSEINDYLATLVLNKKIIGDLADFWSGAHLIKNQLGGNPWQISRNKIFDKIRKLGSKLSKFQADKWCPGDIYFINPKTIDLISDYVSAIEKNIQADSLEKLNLLFKSEISTSEDSDNLIFGSVIAISLKKEAAQAGKAKQFLKSLTPDEKEYNTTKEEMSRADKSLLDDIAEYRKKIADSCSKSVTTIKLIQDSDYTGNGDTYKIQSKFASIKLAYKLLSDSKNIDDNVLKATAFGMSLTGVNPTFFKIIGSSKGVAKEEKYPAGEMIYLMNAGLDNPDSVITIVDKNSNTAINIQLEVRKAAEDHNSFIQLSCKSNGGVQATLEIDKTKKLN